MGQDNLDVILHNMERKPEDWHLDDFRARHLVVTHDSEIHLRVSSQTREQDIYLSIDGKNKIPLAINDEIMVRESTRQAQLVFLEPNYFFHNLASRLSWGGLSR